MVPESMSNVTGGKVFVGKHVIIGAGSVVLPELSIGEGTAVGAMSLVKDSLKPWSVYVGTPARRIGERSKNLLKRLEG